MDNKIIEIFRHRRSVRRYDDTPVSEEALRIILEAGLTAPTGNNRREVEAIVTTDRDKLEVLSRCRKSGTQMLESAGAAIIVIADKSKSDVWIEDASIAMAYMHLAADALGLGSCWVQVWKRESPDGTPVEDKIRGLLGIPEHMRVVAMLSLGNISDHPSHHDSGYMDFSKVHWEKF